MTSSETAEIATINEAPGSPPDADVVFMSVDEFGTRGRLNEWVLQQLGLYADALPSRNDLARGYALRRHGKRLLAFVVTVGHADTRRLLQDNLLAALGDEEVRSARSLWIPLMGTGAGGLSTAVSRELTLQCLAKSGWTRQPGAEITISGPPPPKGAQDALPQSKAVEELLQVAARLRRVRRGGGDYLSTTLLFFALAESGSSELTPALAADPAARGFRSALEALAGDRYAALLQRMFEVEDLPTIGLSERIPRPSANAMKVLQPASAGRERTEIDDVVANLLTISEARVGKRIGELGITADALLAAYRGERSQFIASVLMSDVAGATDRLGYDRYAAAIARFLTDAGTPPPLSISIQAPWGVGKSSLMQQLRYELDPEGVRLAATPPAARRGTPLKIRDVLRFLKARRRKSEWAPEIVAPRHEGRGLWTVWFNAWKYDTSEQVWAGLVTAIVDQISDRLPAADRELFLLNLQLARIDDDVVRSKVHDKVISLAWSTLRRWAAVGGTAIVGMLGFTAAASKASLDLPDWLQAQNAPALLPVAAFAALIAYFLKSREAKNEPAQLSLAEYLQVPPYSEAVGGVHRIHEDLLRVLALTPRLAEAPGAGDPAAAEIDLKAHTPIVIFIDDLDRCSPSKIARVVEGVSMFLASDLFRCFFVIGMDPQFIAAALESEHRDVIAKLPSYERAVPLGWRFMDKFIQLPFTIPPCADETLEQFAAGFEPSEEPQPPGPAPRRLSPEPPDKTHAADEDARERTARHWSFQRALAAVRSFVGARSPEAVATVEPPAAPEDGTTAAPPVARTDLAAAVKRDREGRDVGDLVAALGATAAGNPRELKRMANLGRLYLQLRNVRRAAEPGWVSPGLEHYARWIALASRWPDAMRWLLWGTDEATWPRTIAKKLPLAVRRLQALEDAASVARTAREWQEIVGGTLRVPVDDPSDWANDVKLFDFFCSEADRPKDERISAAAETQFW